jgi:proteasome lid subunit RPN8/RPN11
MIRLELPATLKVQIEAEGSAAFPSECCGIILGRDIREGDNPRRVVERLMPGQNVFEADERYHRFSIDPRLQMQAEREAEKSGQTVLGFYHSHPNHPARPSEYDREHAWPFYSYLIVSILDGKPDVMTSWVLNDTTNQFEEQPIE